MANGRNGVDAETAHNSRTFSRDAANVSTSTLRERLAATSLLQRAAASATTIAVLLVTGAVIRDEPTPKQTPIEQLKGVDETPGVKLFKQLISKDPDLKLTARGRVEKFTESLDMSLSSEFKEKLIRATKGAASHLSTRDVKRLTQQLELLVELDKTLKRSASVPKDINDFDPAKISEFDRSQLDGIAEQLDNSGMRNQGLVLDGSRGDTVAFLIMFNDEAKKALVGVGIDLDTVGKAGPTLSGS